MVFVVRLNSKIGNPRTSDLYIRVYAHFVIIGKLKTTNYGYSAAWFGEKLQLIVQIMLLSE